MNTMEITKIVGGLCGALLVFMLVSWGAEILYHTGGGHGDHGEEHAAGYVIEVEEDASATALVEGPSIDELMASADVDKGAKVFGKCKACHKLEAGANGTGPYLYNIVGREIGTADGFGYSGALSGLGGEWDYTALDGFLENPRKWAPGTTMGFGGLKKPQDRANVIAYLESIVQ